MKTFTISNFYFSILKTNKMTIPKNVINPFSEKFLETWELWKYWRKHERDGFEYKGVISEQMALKKLSELAEGEEEKAISIVEQSIANRWTGFWKVKNSSKKDTDGKSAKQSTTKQSEPKQSLRDQAAAEFNRRNGNGEQQASSDHLKAV
jgi:hypothetical protein